MINKHPGLPINIWTGACSRLFALALNGPNKWLHLVWLSITSPSSLTVKCSNCWLDLCRFPNCVSDAVLAILRFRGSSYASIFGPVSPKARNCKNLHSPCFILINRFFAPWPLNCGVRWVVVFDGLVLLIWVTMLPASLWSFVLTEKISLGLN